MLLLIRSSGCAGRVANHDMPIVECAVSLRDLWNERALSDSLNPSLARLSARCINSLVFPMIAHGSIKFSDFERRACSSLIFAVASAPIAAIPCPYGLRKKFVAL